MSFQLPSLLDFSSLRGALPYMKAFREKIFVVKLAGELCEDSLVLEQIIKQISLLIMVGIKIVVVHGGGKHATELGNKLGIASEFVNGRRVTTKEMLEVTKMSFAGQLNTELVTAFKKQEIPAVGISGIDGETIKAIKRSPKKMLDKKLGKEREIDFGFVADITDVNPKLLNHLLAGGYVPIICSLAADETGQILNINADTLAATVAAALTAIKLCILGTVDGVLQDIDNPQTLLSLLRAHDIEKLLEGKSISGGMIPKLTTALDALKRGVPQVHIVSGTRQDALLQEIFTNEGSGTMIMP